MMIPMVALGQVTVKGIVTEQNSGNRPLAGVQIKALGSTPEQTGKDGLFQLSFTSKKPGDRIIVSEISRAGYEIVNKDVVNNWVVLNDPNVRTRIVMCPEGLTAQNILKYYNISFDALNTSYTERIRQLQQERDEARIDVKTYGEKVKLLSEQFENQQKHIEELAEKFARENFDDCSAIHRQAFDAFEKGDIEGAIRILESVNSNEQIARAREQLKKGEALEKEAKDMQAQSLEIIDQNIKKLLFQVDLYISEFRFEDAINAFEDAVYADTTNYENQIDLAIFLFDQNQYDLSMKWSRSALANAGTKYQRARALIAVANIQSIMDDYAGAEEYFNEATKILTELADEDPEGYSYILAISLNNLGNMYHVGQQFEKARVILEKAMKIREKNSNTPVGETPVELYIYNMLGVVCMELNQLDTAEAWINKGISDLLKSPDVDTALIKYLLANYLDCLSLVQNKKNEPAKAISTSKESLKIIGELAKMNPQRYNHRLFIVLNNITTFYLQMGDYANADRYATEAENIVKELIKKYPLVYKSDLAMV